MKQDLYSVQKLNNGVDMPRFGLGVFKAKPGDEVQHAIRWALDAGYRLIDTAALYENEEDVGQAVAQCGIPREQLFITTKLWVTELGNVEKALDESLKKLHMDYVDMYLIHWPGTDADLRLRAWEEMQRQAEKGKIRVCGVSNFMQDQLELLIKGSGVAPANNQLELHPWRQQRELREYCAQQGVSVTAWGPIFHGHLQDVPLVGEIAQKYGRSAAQVTLRWHVQRGINIIPKSVNKDRIEQNAQIFDFELSTEDMARIDALDGHASFAFDAHTFNGDVVAARQERVDKLAQLGLTY